MMSLGGGAKVVVVQDPLETAPFWEICTLPDTGPVMGSLPHHHRDQVPVWYRAVRMVMRAYGWVGLGLSCMHHHAPTYLGHIRH